MDEIKANVGAYECGDRCDPLLIAGPCVLEDLHSARRIATGLVTAVQGLPFQLVFKASFDKANRTSLSSYRGPGIDQGLEILSEIKREFSVPVTTDVHLPEQAAIAAEVCELLQIPAFLCRQTDLLVAASESGAAVNVKKGQFMAPADMEHVAGKLSASGCRNLFLCERGTFFGYGRLVNDMRALVEMRQLGHPVIFDATHSVQEPGGLGGTTGGQRDMVEPLARAAVAIGVDGLFLETHFDPSMSPSDGPNMVPLENVAELLQRLTKIRESLGTNA